MNPHSLCVKRKEEDGEGGMVGEGGEVVGGHSVRDIPRQRQERLFAEARRIGQEQHGMDSSHSNPDNNNSWNMGYKRKTCIVRLDGCRYTIGKYGKSHC